MGLGRVELPTSPLSGVRSNQLSYRPNYQGPNNPIATTDRIKQFVWILMKTMMSSIKEVIQPQVPLRLPCYDFTPVMNHTVVTVLPKVRLATSGATHSHGVTGGVYKARERIHRSNADLRLLAIPTSRSRVADSDPDWDQVSGIGLPSRVRSPLS